MALNPRVAAINAQRAALAGGIPVYATVTTSPAAPIKTPSQALGEAVRAYVAAHYLDRWAVASACAACFGAGLAVGTRPNERIVYVPQIKREIVINTIEVCRYPGKMLDVKPTK